MRKQIKTMLAAVLASMAWVFDRLVSQPLEQLRQNPVRRISISYHNEVPAGEHFQVQRGSTQNGWYVSGTREGKCCFEAELTL